MDSDKGRWPYREPGYMRSLYDEHVQAEAMYPPSAMQELRERMWHDQLELIAENAAKRLDDLALATKLTPPRTRRERKALRRQFGRL